MTPEHWRRVKDLFEAALAREPATRAGFVAAAAAGEPGLAEEVLKLVASDEKAGTFLSGPVPGAGFALRAGWRIGPYRVLGEIGHGGMGAVLRAVRDDDQFQKQVAIKLVRGGIGSEFVIERFKAERQILADLEHANIARLIDGGATEEGWPWFALELVEGQPIDQFCSSRAFSVPQRLELFRTVCSAVQYAHQRLVVHRDLKPGNILVTGEGIPKLLDFGIAKLLGAEVPATVTAFPLMTPEYASPEQVRGEAITTATDVYSLGMLLYELLAGRRAYGLPNRSPTEIARVVCEMEPLPASAVAPRERARQLAGDLDTIVSKAIRKEPARRYASVQELSEDIWRHLAGLPVRARGDTLSYRAGKFVRRHKAGVAAAALVAVSLLGGIVATVRQARIAEANRARAERRFNDVRKLASSLLFEFHDAIKDLPGSIKARELIVQRALEYLDSLSQESHQDVALQRELAVAYQSLGDAQGGVHGNLQDTKGALASYQKALAIRRALALSPGQVEDEEGLASLERQLSSLLVQTGDLKEGEEIARAATARLESLAARTGSDRRLQLGALYHMLGYIQGERGEDGAALESLGKAVAVGQAWCAEHPDNARAQASLARVQTDMLAKLGEQGQHHRAAESARSTWNLLEQLVRTDPNNALYRRNLIYALNLGSDELEADGDLAGANDARRRSVELAEALVVAEPASNDQISLAYSHQGLGVGLVHAGEAEAGLAHLREALRVAELSVKSDPGNAFARSRPAEIQSALGLALHGLGRRNAEMCSSLLRSVAWWEGLDRAGRLPERIRPDLERSRAAFAGCRDR